MDARAVASTCNSCPATGRAVAGLSDGTISKHEQARCSDLDKPACTWDCHVCIRYSSRACTGSCRAALLRREAVRRSVPQGKEPWHRLCSSRTCESSMHCSHYSGRHHTQSDAVAKSARSQQKSAQATAVPLSEKRMTDCCSAAARAMAHV